MGIIRGIINEGSSCRLLRRIENEITLQPITQADVAGLTVEVFDLDDPTAPVNGTITLDIPTTISNSLNTNWDVDSIGYNVALSLSGDNFPRGNTTYQVELTLTPTVGSAQKFIWQLQTIALFSL